MTWGSWGYEPAVTHDCPNEQAFRDLWEQRPEPPRQCPLISYKDTPPLRCALVDGHREPHDFRVPVDPKPASVVPEPIQNEATT